MPLIFHITLITTIIKINYHLYTYNNKNNNSHIVIIKNDSTTRNVEYTNVHRQKNNILYTYMYI